MRITFIRDDTNRRWSTALLAAVLTAVLTIALLAPAATAETTGTGGVGATVTPSDWPEACILVGASGLDFGELLFSREGETQSGRATVDGGSAEDYQVTNCSTDEQGFLVSATDADDGEGASWLLVATPPIDVCASTDQYRLGIEVQDPNTQAYASPPQMVLLGSGVTGLPYSGRTGTEPTRVAAGDSRTVRNTIYMPCEGSSGSGSTMGMTINFLALLD